MDVKCEQSNPFEDIADTQSDNELGQLPVEYVTQKEKLMEIKLQESEDTKSRSSGNRFSRKLKTFARKMGLRKCICVPTISDEFVKSDNTGIKNFDDDELFGEQSHDDELFGEQSHDEDFVIHDKMNIDEPQDCEFLSEDDTLVISSLGRPFKLGMLYDARNDQICPGMNLWHETSINAALSFIAKPSSSYELFTGDNLTQKLLSLDIEPNLSLSVMTGLVDVSCSRSYLNDRISSENQARVILKYYYASQLEFIKIEDLGVGNIQDSDLPMLDCATHVVTEILYGAEAFCVFDRNVSQTENYREIHEKMKFLVSYIPEVCSIEGNANSKIRENDRLEMNKCQFKFYCDVLPEENISTFQDAVELFKRLPQIFNQDAGKMTPKKIWLFPLSKIYKRAPRLVREINTNLVTQIYSDLGKLYTIEIRCNDLLKTKVYDIIPGFKNQMMQFMEMISTFQGYFFEQLASVLPKIRGGLAEETEIIRLREILQEFPFNANSLSIWLDNKESESKALFQYIEILEKTPGVRFSFAPGALESVINDIQHNNVISFEFKVVNKNDDFLQCMLTFLREQTINPNYLDISPDQWYKNANVMKDMRQKVKQFICFAEANEGSDEMIFIVSDSSNEYNKENPRAFLLRYENGLPFQFEPPGQPGKPTAIKVTDDSVHLEWKQPEHGMESIKYYTVRYQSTPDESWKTRSTELPETVLVIDYLNPESKYSFIVRGECGFGSSKESEPSDMIETKPSPVNPKIQKIIDNSSIFSEGPPVIYKLPVRRTFVCEDMAKMEFGEPTHPSKPNKVLMVVGATGAGKSTLINGIVNYIFGVKWESKFRFILITEEIGKSQAHSQTQTITAYTFYWQEGSPIDYSLTVVDTPGFGDTRGLERDQQITDNIREFFSLKGPDGIEVLDGVGFVMQASLARLTPTQKYISDSILSIFGKDIKDNIFIMTTFADGSNPPVMDAVKEANIPFAEFFSFNNSALFENSNGSEFIKMFWEIGYSSFRNFFIHFGKTTTVSIQLTREVLEERKQLQTIVEEIQPQINLGMSKLDEIQQEKQILISHESKVLANENFEYEVKVTKQKQTFVPKGTFVTNCATCHYTCHRSCAYEDDRDKWRCSAMSGNEDDAKCRVCPGECPWARHFNNGYLFDLYEEVETRTSHDLLERYNEAKTGIINVEVVIKKMEQEFEEIHQGINFNVRRARKCLQRLDEIALRPNPLTEVEYIDLLIKSEEQQKNPGWKKRIDYFYQVREQAELLSSMTDQDAVDAITSESNKSVWSKFTRWVKKFLH